MTDTPKLDDVPYKPIRIKARDWALTKGQYRTDGVWRPMEGHICGWLLDETEDSLTIGMQLFHRGGDESHWETRWSVTIPRETIIERLE